MVDKNLQDQALQFSENMTDEQLSLLTDRELSDLSQGLQGQRQAPVEIKFDKLDEFLTNLEGLSDEDLKAMDQKEFDNIQQFVNSDFLVTELSNRELKAQAIPTIPEKAVEDFTDIDAEAAQDAVSNTIMAPIQEDSTLIKAGKIAGNFNDLFEAIIVRTPKTVAEDLTKAAYSVGAELGLTTEQRALEVQNNINSARDQEFNQTVSPTAARIGSSVTAGIAEFATGAKLAKLGLGAAGLAAKAPKLAGAASEAVGGAVSSALQSDRGDRASGAIFGATLGGLLGAATTPAKSLPGTEQAIKRTGVQLLPGQLSGNKLTSAVEDWFSAVPLVGTAGAFKRQYKDILTNLDDVSNSLAQSARQQQIGVLSKADKFSKASLYDDVVADSLNTLKRMKASETADIKQLVSKVNKIGPQELLNTKTAAQNILGKINDFTDVPNNVKDLLTRASTIKNGNFDDMWNLRQSLDRAISTASGPSGNKTSEAFLTQLRKSVTDDLVSTADKGGVGKIFKDINAFHAERIAPLQQTLFKSKDSSDAAFQLVNQVISKNTKPEQAKILINSLSAQGKDALGFASIRHALEKSAMKGGMLDLAKFNDEIKQASSVLGRTLKKDHKQTIEGLSTIIDSLSDTALKVGRGGTTSNRALTQMAGALGVAGIGGAAAAGVVDAKTVGTAVVGTLLARSLLLQRSGIDAIKKVGTNKQLAQEYVAKILNLTGKNIIRGSISASAESVTGESK